MGKIRGDVEVFGLANLLQVLAQNQKEGVLTIFQGNDKKSIHFGAAGMRLLATTRRKANSIGEILIRTGKISRTQLAALLEEQKTSGRRLGDLVARSGVLSKDDIDHALREQVAEEIYDLFGWKNSSFEFAEQRILNPEADNPLAEVLLNFNVTSLMLEAARRADEMERIRKVIPDNRHVPVRAGPEPKLDDPNLDRSVAEMVWPLIDGTFSVTELVESALYPEFQVLSALYVLANQGALKFQARRGIGAPRKREESTVILPPTKRADRKSVLIFSTMPKYLTAIASIVRGAGVDTIEESRVDGISSAVERHRPDAAIVDLSDAADIASLSAAKIPYIVLSSNSSKEAVLAAIRGGARDYIVKPINDQVLLQRLQGLLQLSCSPSPEGVK